MANYLFFFGKSQDFTAYAFDQNDYIADFNSVIKNFDLLESQYFNIDEINNGEIIAKYIFNDANGKRYSLIKLYEFAQALDGNRIAGSSFGVALLSDVNLVIGPENYNILRAAKDNFSKLCIQNSKFTKSDFLADVHKIWKALANNEQGNLISAYKTTPFKSQQSENSALGVLINDPKQILNHAEVNALDYGKIYYTTDLEHLKRAYNKWGNLFKIYEFEQNKIVPYKEPKPIIESSSNSTTVSSQPNSGPKSIDHLKIVDLESEIAYLKNTLKTNEQTVKKYKLMFVSALVLCFILMLSFLLRSPAKKSADIPAPVQKIEYIDYNITSLLTNSDSLQKLNALVDNIILLEKSKKQNLNQENNFKLQKTITEQGQELKIDVSFTKAYLPTIDDRE
jgi:cbb3-type cytochrome oxidase subunit 3